MNFLFFLNSAALGVGLAMDAFSVSIVNGLREPAMRRHRMACIAGVYAAFQFLMPLLGWFCVHTVANLFTAFQVFIPWIALFLLCYIGGKMLIESIHSSRGEDSNSGEGPAAEKVGGKAVLDAVQADEQHSSEITWGTLIIQGIATSIDALSVGFTIADYGLSEAVCCCLIIAVVTFVICMIGLIFGKRFGERLANRAGILGGVILILIGIEIFVNGVIL